MFKRQKCKPHKNTTYMKDNTKKYCTTHVMKHGQWTLGRNAVYRTFSLLKEHSDGGGT